MRLQPKDLSVHLKEGLAPLYVIGGTEPLQRQEALDAIRAQAIIHGYTEREVIESLGVAKDEERLGTLLNSPSLFAEKRLIEYRLSEGKITKLTQQILLKHLPCLPPNIVLIIFYPDKLDPATLKSSWFTTVEGLAKVILSYPISLDKFPPWLQERAKKLDLILEKEALDYLAVRTEGNLIAANQTLEKIALLVMSDPKETKAPKEPKESKELKKIQKDLLERLMIWENKHSVFDLADSVLEGAYARTSAILESLKNEGIEPSLICYAIAREVRNLIPLAKALEERSSLTDEEKLRFNNTPERIPSQLLNQFGVWKIKQPLVVSFLQRKSLSDLYDILSQAKRVDALIKTSKTNKAWHAIQALCYFCCRGLNAWQIQ